MRSTASHGAPQADPGTGGRAAAQCGVRGGAEHDLAGAGRGEQAGRRFGRRRRRSRPGSSARAPRSKRRRPRPGRHSQKAIGRSRAHPRADSRMSRLVIAAELLGHARLETTRVYTAPDRRGPQQSRRPAARRRAAALRAARRVLMHLLALSWLYANRTVDALKRLGSQPREHRPDPHTARSPQLHPRTAPSARQRPRDRPPPASQPRTARPHRCRGASPRAHPPAPSARP